MDAKKYEIRAKFKQPTPQKIQSKFKIFRFQRISSFVGGW